MKYKFLTCCLLAIFAVSSFAQQGGGRRPRITSILEIYDISTGTRTAFREFNSRIEAPNWTPDGKSLIYNSNGLIYKISSENPEDQPTQINTDFINGIYNHHVVSADGKLLAISGVTREDRQQRIYILPIEGGVPQLVTAMGQSYLHSMSPDGNFIAYGALRGDNYDVYVIPTKGGVERRLTAADSIYDDAPDYSPDGKYIWFNSVRTGLMQIWRMKANAFGSEQTQMTFDEDFNSWFPHVSPDGKQVVFMALHKDDVTDPAIHPAFVGNKNVVLRLMPAEGGKPVTIVELFGGQGTINVGSWAPDSKRFAFVSYRIEAPTEPPQQ